MASAHLATVSLFLLVAASGGSFAQAPIVLEERLTIAAGSGPGALSLFAVVEDGSQTVSALPGFGGIELLPIELAGRLDFHRFDATRPRRLLTDDGLSRIALPGGTSVFHYRRGSLFGFLAIGPEGLPRILLELPGGGDPFLPSIAASRDGTRLAAATLESAGGDAWLIALGGGPLANGSMVANLSGPSELEIDPESLAFANGTLFFTGEDGLVFRAPSDGSAPPSALALPPSGGAIPSEVRSEFAVSDDGSTIAFVAGASEDSGDVYVVRPPTGPAVNLTQDAREYESVGYAPGSAFGPMLALSPDGSLIAYVETVDENEEEFFLRSTLGGPPLQVTADALFEPYIDNVVVVTIGAANDVCFGAGGQALSQLDFYRAIVGPGPSLDVVNLTGTSGSFTPPFLDTGTIAIVDAFALPGSSGMAVVSGGAAGFEVRFLDDEAGTSSLVLAGQSWNGGGVGPAGGRLFFDAVGSGGTPRLYAFTGGPAPSVQTLLSAPPGLTLDSLTASPSGSEISFLASAGPGLDWAVRLAVPGGSIWLLNAVPLSFSRSVAYSPSGVPGFALGPSPTGPFVAFLIPPSGPAVPAVPPGMVRFLR